MVCSNHKVGILYFQIVDFIKKQIRSGQLGSADTLPSERKLSDTLNISRVSIPRTVDYLVEDDIIMRKQGYLPTDCVSNPEMNGNSLYHYLNEHGVFIARALQNISAINANKTLSQQAGIKLKTALLKITRTILDANNRLIEVTATRCQANYYNFIFELTQ